MSRQLLPPLLDLLRAVRAARRGGPDALTRLGQARVDRAVRRAAGGPTRRGVLVGAAALAACTPAPKAGTARPGLTRVAILGAGLAGLDCCHRLAQAGIRAEVYDARDRVGGRVVTGRDLFPGVPGLTCELGAEWVNSADTELLALVDELGLSLHDSWEEFDLETMVWFDGRRVEMRSLLADLDRLTAACDAALAGLPEGGAAISYTHPDGAQELDATSAADWLAGLGLGEDARRYAETITLADYGRELDDQSALNVISFFTDVGEDLYDERYLVAGGNDQVPLALGERYADRIHLGAEVTAIRALPTGAWIVSFADGTEVTADVLVNTLPFTVLRTLALDAEMPAVKRSCIDTLGYGTNAKLLLPFAERFWRTAGDSGLVITDLFQEGWDASMLQGLPGGAFATFRGGSAGVAVGSGDVAARGAELLDQLEQLWPGCALHLAGDAVRAAWPDDPWVQGSYSCYRVGQWTGIGGAEGEPVGSQFFAGEHTSYAFQGYMNGAAQSGADAAADVVALLDGGRRRARPVRAGRRRRPAGAR